MESAQIILIYLPPEELSGSKREAPTPLLKSKRSSAKHPAGKLHNNHLQKGKWLKIRTMTKIAGNGPHLH